MINLENKENCYGCGMCEVVCPQKNIKIIRSEEGFYVPKILDKNKCVNCGLCEKICPYQNKENVLKSRHLETYAIFSKDDKVLKTSSSGGVAHEISKLFFNDGYKVCGVKYNYEFNRAEHFIAEKESDLELMKGSKYIQSYTVGAFKKFDSKNKWLVFGTPCQIDAIRRWIKLKNIEDNYILVDIFCHGVPSYLLWEKYLEYQSKKHNIENFSNINFRDKKFGWHAITISLSNGLKKVNNRSRRFDLFYGFFLSDVCLNSCCYENCKFKNAKSSADIRLGDLWGEKYQNNNKGVSGVITYNNKGEQIIKELRNSCNINTEQIDVITACQIKNTLKTPSIRKKVIKNLAKKNSSIQVIFTCAILSKMIFVIIPQTILRKLLNLIKMNRGI